MDKPWMSSYQSLCDNPILNIDPNGDSKDWFENEITGEVYYNSAMKKGQEGTGAMKGEGWVHMGENGMFKTHENDAFNSDYNVLLRAGVEIKKKTTFKYPNAPYGSKKSLETSGFHIEAKMSSTYSVIFMSNLGYRKVPKDYVLSVHVTTTIHTNNDGSPIYIDVNESRISEVYTTQYIYSKGYSVSTTVHRDLTSHKTFPGFTQLTGPKYCRDTFHKRTNFEHWDTLWNVFDSTVNWKEQYKQLWQKILKQ